MTQRHDDSLDDFARGETAQVLARDRRTGELVFLAAGQASAVRPAAREHFECPFPGCDSPAPLTTRGGTYRDHFVHMSPHTHPGGPESLDHFQAKHLIAAWARERAAAACIDVVVNDEEWSPDVRRRPDVLATWPDGRRVAFEVEYKAYPVAAWTEKNADYRRAGITVVWIFGHSPARYLRPDNRIGGTRPEGAARGYRLGALTSAVVADSQPVLFINPVTSQIATLWSDGTPLTRRAPTPSGSSDSTLQRSGRQADRSRSRERPSTWPSPTWPNATCPQKEG
ncbi:hypothetical protein DDP54_00800 (plasmid) [Cellulomonas sp. WB94]|uniref:competence protein CoiA family protein n=1 Tax=Cellulomonas sp. WB94 TaxID=2173174 RepID=UPI000D5882FF|nr:competence protein CoiA family protein [Cellulomonas sp. WB94]PVU84420.1 hypothetical protein DDP54_00800 [Cellulomonas sp. WB94]